VCSDNQLLHLKEFSSGHESDEETTAPTQSGPGSAQQARPHTLATDPEKSKPPTNPGPKNPSQFIPAAGKFPGPERQSRSGFEKTIAIPIAIENRSGKIGNRFHFRIGSKFS
jgi:hypothetical protein